GFPSRGRPPGLLPPPLVGLPRQIHGGQGNPEQKGNPGSCENIAITQTFLRERPQDESSRPAPSLTFAEGKESESNGSCDARVSAPGGGGGSKPAPHRGGGGRSRIPPRRSGIARPLHGQDRPG